jgi:putative flippase GtrA
MVGYGAASAAALVVDMTILWSLVRYAEWNYLVAATTSYLAGAGVAYVLSLQWAFKQHLIQDRRLEFIAFVAIGLAGLAVNAGVISALVGYFGFQVMPAKCVAAAFTFLSNFLTRRRMLFYRRSPLRDLHVR